MSPFTCDMDLAVNDTSAFDGMVIGVTILAQPLDNRLATSLIDEVSVEVTGRLIVPLEKDGKLLNNCEGCN